MLTKLSRKLPPILVEFMAGRELEPQQAAEFFGVRHTTYYGWLRGAHVPPRPAAKRLAKKLRRPDLVELIDQDRTAHRRSLRRAERIAAVSP